MGFLAGVVGELNRQEDKAERREEFMMNLLEKRKAAILPQVMDRIEKRNAKVAERTSRMRAAALFKITDEAAAVLETTGELSLILSKLSKEETVNTAAIERLSDAAVANLKPEQIGAAMEYAFSVGYASDPTSDKLVEAIYANTEEDFSSALSGLMPSATPAAPGLGRIGVNLGALSPVSETRLANIRKNIEDSLAARLGYDANKSTKDGYAWTDPENAEEIINNALLFYTEQVTDPVAQRNPENIMRQIIASVDYLKTDMSLSLEQVAEQSDFPITGVEVTEVKTTNPPPTGAATPSTATSTLMEEVGVNPTVDSGVSSVWKEVEEEDKDGGGF